MRGWRCSDGRLLTVLSLRYTDYGVVEASLAHVTEFHKGLVRVAPGAWCALEEGEIDLGWIA
eukprot:COSAG02_NODE_5256_length_4493_cov_3.387119_5_plen_62_part_00